MTRVIGDITVSLDGYVTAPGADIAHGLGIDGEALHNWVFNGDDVDKAVLAEATERSGAVVMGRNLFDVVDGPDGWSDDIGYGAGHNAAPPFFVVTHRGRPESRAAHARLHVRRRSEDGGRSGTRRGGRSRRGRDGRRQHHPAVRARRTRRRVAAARVANRVRRRHAVVHRRRPRRVESKPTCARRPPPFM